ncbi:MAG: MFS transporter [Anaerolineae bacterium]|nr:MFS transporter [Anaerolineae bacterium]
MSTETPARPSQLTFERVAPIFALTFVDILGLTIILPLLHLYAIAFGATPLQVGLAAAAFPLAQIIGVPVMGALSDRFGRKPLLLISQITTCISFVMLALANSLWIVVLSRVVDGLFGANIATAQAAISDITRPDERARGLGITGAAFGLGFMLGPAIAAIALEFSDDLGAPAWIAAGYSLLSILLTLFLFRETLPPAHRESEVRAPFRFGGLGWLKGSHLIILLLLMFAQQVVFYGFESLLGLFTLNRVGLLGQGVAFIFVVVGIILVFAQLRLIGPLSRRFGDARVAQIALVLVGAGLLLLASTPAEPHPFYVQRIVENEIAKLAPSGTEIVIGSIPVALPPESARGLGGIVWLMLALVPVALGAGMIRPGLNSLMTRREGEQNYGRILGASAAAVSAANAVAPLLGGFLFQQYGATIPFGLGGALMLVLALLMLGIRSERAG